MMIPNTAALLRVLVLASVTACGVVRATVTDAPALLTRPTRYDRHALIRIPRTAKATLDAIDARGMDVWVETPMFVDVRASSSDMNWLRDNAWTPGVHVLDANIQRSIDHETARLSKQLLEGGTEDLVTAESELAALSRWRPYDEINAWIRALPERFPQLVSMRTIGTSWEGRALLELTVTAPTPGNGTVGAAKKPIVWIQAMQHAREWISVAVIQNLIYQLVQGYTRQDPAITRLLGTIEFRLVPMVNPDGYVYTWTTDRLWRRNRRPSGAAPGVDLNRNWPDHFGESGASPDPTRQEYHGPSAASELEVQALIRAMTQAAQQSEAGLALVIDLHSYGEQVLFPPGWTKNTTEAYERPEVEQAYRALGGIIHDTVRALTDDMIRTESKRGPKTPPLFPKISYLNVSEADQMWHSFPQVLQDASQNDLAPMEYTCIPISEMYLASGGLVDWAHNAPELRAHGVRPYAIAVELGPPPRVFNGFVVGDEWIAPVSQVMGDALWKAIAWVVAGNNGNDHFRRD